jgi:hypothetical protein
LAHLLFERGDIAALKARAEADDPFAWPFVREEHR